MKTNRLTSATRRGGGVTTRLWRSGLQLCLTAAVLMLGNARAVDLDPVLRGTWPPFACGPAEVVAISGNFAYLADAWSDGLEVIRREQSRQPTSFRALPITSPTYCTGSTSASRRDGWRGKPCGRKRWR